MPEIDPEIHENFNLAKSRRRRGATVPSPLCHGSGRSSPPCQNFAQTFPSNYARPAASVTSARLRTHSDGAEKVHARLNSFEQHFCPRLSLYDSAYLHLFRTKCLLFQCRVVSTYLISLFKARVAISRLLFACNRQMTPSLERPGRVATKLGDEKLINEIQRKTMEKPVVASLHRQERANTCNTQRKEHSRKSNELLCNLSKVDPNGSEKN